VENIIGMMWNKNEADILPQIIDAALPHVDALFIADDGSTDDSWSIIKNHSSKKIEYTQRSPDKHDPGQREALLNEIKKRYKPENTWVQIIESDIMILDTNIREAIKLHSVEDMALTWHLLNGARRKGDWNELDVFPNWDRPISEVMPWGHWIESMLYTFRPLPNLHYVHRATPWPRGWTHYTKSPMDRISWDKTAPLLAHYGYRGPTHFYLKYKSMGAHHKKYTDWKLGSPREVEDTVYFFNGVWNGLMHPLSRQGWLERNRWKRKF